MKKTLPIFYLVFMFLISCGKDVKKSSEEQQNVSPIYSSKELHIEVFYEPGAEPYTDAILGKKIWDLFEMNLNALFEGRKSTPHINVPKDLAQMTKVSSTSKTQWSLQDVLALSKTYGKSSESGKSTFQIFFLNGHAAEGPSIIGFNISGTKVIAIFKDVIKSSGSNEAVLKYVEQATLVHEMGHAVGLVNNGVPMQENHQDSPHGAHCTHEDCVMYYANEGAASMFKFAQNAFLKGSLVMFGNQCLTDSRNF